MTPKMYFLSDFKSQIRSMEKDTTTCTTSSVRDVAHPFAASGEGVRVDQKACENEKERGRAGEGEGAQGAGEVRETNTDRRGTEHGSLCCTCSSA